MYTIGNRAGAIKTVQRYLGLSESGIFDDKTRVAVKEFQSARNLEITGVVDYISFVLLRSHFYENENARNAAKIAPTLKFPVKFGDSGPQITRLNSELSEALANYSFYGILPRGSFYNSYTSGAVVRLREIFGLKSGDVVDEELYMRLQRERLTRP